MIRMLIAAGALLLASCATPAATKDHSPATGGAASDAGKPTPKLICERETLTGSRLSTRVCRPAKGADSQRDATQMEVFRRRVSEPPRE